MTLITTYRPLNCKVRPWLEIEDSYNRFYGEQYKSNMGELVRHIIQSGLSNRLYGLTSMWKLIIGIYDPIEWHRETLHVTYEIEKDNWHFVYYSIPFREPGFVRTYPLESGIMKFDQFIKMVRW